jgi:hypothetical protein
MNAQQKVELAQQLYREYRATCFWSCQPDLVITEDLITFVAEGLRENGGRKGFLAASPLRQRVGAG